MYDTTMRMLGKKQFKQHADCVCMFLELVRSTAMDGAYVQVKGMFESIDWAPMVFVIV